MCETRPLSHAVEDVIRHVQGGVVVAMLVYNTIRQNDSLRDGEQQGPCDITDLQKDT